jgi:hypothetical protein
MGTSQAQDAFAGKFTLIDQVHWGESVLQPGDYTIRVKSTRLPIIAAIHSNKSGAALFVKVTSVISDIPRNRQRGFGNALLMKAKGGQLCVHSVALADLNMVLIYDPLLAQQSVQEAQMSKTVPVMWAKK